MDDRQFDTLAQRIGATDRRGFLKALLGIGGVAVTGVLGVEAASAAPQERVQICHATGNGSFRLITVAASAVDAHLDHGDGQLGSSDHCTACGDACVYYCIGETWGCCNDSQCLL